MLCRGPRMLFFGQNMLDIMAFCTSETICFPWAMRIMSFVGCYFNNVGVSCGIDICHPALRKPPTMLIQGTDDGRATAAQVTRRRTWVAGGTLIPNSVRLLRRTATPQKLSPGARGLSVVASRLAHLCSSQAAPSTSPLASCLPLSAYLSCGGGHSYEVRSGDAFGTWPLETQAR